MPAGRDMLHWTLSFKTKILSSEANEIAEKESKKTIAAEHVDKALRELGFPEYVSEVLAVAGEQYAALQRNSSSFIPLWESH